MSRRRYRAGEIDPGLSVRAEVNLVNLVDVALVLLVIFMITAPMLQGGVEVALPRADVPPITSQEDGLIVTVTKDGKIFVQETEVAPGAFADEFPQLLVGSKAKFVYIKADQEAMYGDVLRVVATVHRAEGVRMGLLGEPTPRR